VVILSFVYLSSFSLVSFDNVITEDTIYGPEDWKDYKSWTKITKEPNTGDPTGFLSKELYKQKHCS